MVSIQGEDSFQGKSVDFTVTLNLFGRNAIIKLCVNVTALLGLPVNKQEGPSSYQAHFKGGSNTSGCMQAHFLNCSSQVECLKEFQLEVNFKQTQSPSSEKHEQFLLPSREDLCQAYAAGIDKGVWQTTQINNEYRTPVVPICKTCLPGQPAKLVNRLVPTDAQCAEVPRMRGSVQKNYCYETDGFQ